MHRRILFLLPLFLMVAGCAEVRREVENFPKLFNPSVNMVEHNYGAADALIGQARSVVSVTTPVAIGALHPTNLPPDEKVPPFGRVVADQIGTRLVQLGYDIRTIDRPMGDGSERNDISRAQGSGASAVITGSYVLTPYDVMLTVRLMGLDSGRILASTDYRLPIGAETGKLLNRDGFWTGPAKRLDEKKTAAAQEVGHATLPPSEDLPVRIIP